MATKRRRVSRADATPRTKQNQTFAFFFARLPQPAFPLVRISIGMALFVHYLRLWPVLEEFFGPGGLGGSAFLAELPSNAPFTRDLLVHWTWLTLAPSSLVVYFVWAALLISAATFAIGIRIRASGVILFISHLLLHARFEYVFWGWADMAQPFLLYAILSPATRAWSWDSRHLESKELLLAPAWSLRLLRFHAALLYFVVAFSRVTSPPWRDGTMVFRILMDTLFSRVAEISHGPLGFWQALAHGAWVLELLAPFGLLIPRLRVPFAIGLIAIHLGLEALTMVGWWNVMMIAVLTGFLPPDFVIKAVGTLLRFAPIRGAILSRGRVSLETN